MHLTTVQAPTVDIDPFHHPGRKAPNKDNAMNPHPTSAAIEQAHLEAQAKSPIGAFATSIRNTATEFDLEQDSLLHGNAVGMTVAAEPEPYRSGMVTTMRVWAGSDPQHDAAVIGLIRAGSPTIRQFLNSDAVAREFARRVGRRALLVLAETTQKNRN